jgi:transcriptional regulator with XRE-family HTH domain
MSVPKEVRAFGAEVRRRRESLGWTLPELAKRSGLTSNYIGSVEIGLRDPSMSTLVKIAKGFCAAGRAGGARGSPDALIGEVAPLKNSGT